MKYLSIQECQPRHVYRIHSRNLSIGVFNPKNENAFIGIRCKWEDEFLFSEYHWDNGPPFGTVKPLEDIGVLPDDIELKETIETIDVQTRKPVYYDETPDEHGNGVKWLGHNEEIKVRGWCWKDTGIADVNIRPMNLSNVPLFNYLKNLEKNSDGFGKDSESRG